MMDLANVEGDEIVIRINIDTLPIAAETAFETNFDEDEAPKVTDAQVFAGELVRALNREEEDGTTLVHTMLDAACNAAAEDGAEGLSEPSALTPSQDSRGV